MCHGDPLPDPAYSYDYDIYPVSEHRTSVVPGGHPPAPPGDSPSRLEKGIETLARGDDFAVPAGEPRADPVGALEEGKRSAPAAPYAHAKHEAARIDEAHVLENVSGRGDAHGDGAEPRDGSDGLSDAAEAEGVGAAQQRGRQRRAPAPRRS